ncbi:MAG TPA: hypothetical protein DEP66_07310, partial [Acidimicrobiaceae bacterium]|nr:hypothetical protein [Acidimicrobiaceae bacterium]
MNEDAARAAQVLRRLVAEGGNADRQRLAELTSLTPTAVSDALLGLFRVGAVEPAARVPGLLRRPWAITDRGREMWRGLALDAAVAEATGPDDGASAGVPADGSRADTLPASVTLIGTTTTAQPVELPPARAGGTGATRRASLVTPTTSTLSTGGGVGSAVGSGVG